MDVQLVGSVYRSLVCRLLLVTFMIVSSTSGFEINGTEDTTNAMGPEINGTLEVTNLMDQLFNDNHACPIPAMELGFLVSGIYDHPSGVSERAFRKALEFVKMTAKQIKISDSGTHVGLVVYGKKPSMAFDFNEHFDMPSLSRAIEEVKRPDNGNKVGEALLFTKEQLFDKSARPGISKALIVLLTKNSEDVLQQGIDALREAGVNIYTVGIEAKTDPMEMSDIASDVKNTFFTDYDHLGSLAKTLAPKLCQAPSDPAMESNDENNQMNPDEEPGAASANVIISPGVRLPSKQEPSTTKASQPNKQIHTDNHGAKMIPNTTSDDDNFQDAVSNTVSSHVHIFDVLADSKEPTNETIGMNGAISDTTSGEEMTTSGENPAGDTEESMSSSGTSVYDNSANPRDSTSPVFKERTGAELPLKKICYAKADIGILIDGSSSVKEQKFSKLLDFTKSLVSSFSVSKGQAHIAVATASRGPQMSFDFQGFQDIPSLNTAISRIAYHGGPFMLGSSLTGLKTSWFKNSGRKSIPQLLMVLATNSSIDNIVAPSRVLRDRGVRIESVGIGPHFDGTQLKEIATHPAQDHVIAVSKFELLPMIRPLLTFRMCRAIGGKLIPASRPGITEKDQLGETNSASSSKEGIGTNINKAQQLPTIKPLKQDTESNPETEAEPEDQQVLIKKEKLEAELEKLEQHNQMHDASNSRQKDGIKNAKIREGIRRKLYALLRRLGGSKKVIGAAYRSFIYNINGHHDSANCKDKHDLCEQWAKSNLCERGNDTMDPQSVQRVCPKSCNVCFR